MKKLIVSIAFIVALSLSTFAGEIPAGPGYVPPPPPPCENCLTAQEEVPVVAEQEQASAEAYKGDFALLLISLFF